MPYPDTDQNDTALAIRAEAERYLAHRTQGGLFPQDMNGLQAAALARLAVMYHLDPFAEELILFQGRPYLTLRGALRVANDHPAFDGMDCVPASDAERAGFKCDERDHLWVATVWRKDRSHPTTNYGRSGPGDRNAVAAQWGPELAMKRAKHRALRDAFSLPALGIEEAGATPEADASLESAPLDDDGIPFPDPVARPITPGQVAAIHASVHELGWDDATYRGALEGAFGVRSSKELDASQAQAFLDLLAAERARQLSAVDAERSADLRAGMRERLQRTSAEATALMDSPGPEMATPAQVAELERACGPSLWRELRRLRGEDLGTLTRAEAGRMLTALHDSPAAGQRALAALQP